MEVKVGKLAGFCFGVKNAVEQTEKQLQQEKEVYCLGELTHNRQVMEQLARKGLHVIEKIEEAPEKATVIIRAHGVPPVIYEKAKKRNIKLVDLTCVKVLKIHQMASELVNQQYYIFLTGHKQHPEVIGIAGCCKNSVSIIEKEEDIGQAIQNWKARGKEKIALISQTTFHHKKWEEIVQKVQNLLPTNEIKVLDTICPATSRRQAETEEMAKQMDQMIIIGGKNSSNTEKLYTIAKENCNQTIWIETKEDLKDFQRKGKIGIMAGASTPATSIEEVVKWIEGN